MLDYLFIIIYTSISKSIQKPVRISRTYTLVSYLLSFWIINFLIVFYAVFDLKYKIQSVSKIAICFIVLFVFITIYFLCKRYYGAAGRDTNNIATYESYSDVKNKWLRLTTFLIMIGTAALFIYLGCSF